HPPAAPPSPYTTLFRSDRCERRCIEAVGPLRRWEKRTMSDRPKHVPVGKLPELGVVPETMSAYVIRPERFGEPKKSFVREDDVPDRKSTRLNSSHVKIS